MALGPRILYVSRGTLLPVNLLDALAEGLIVGWRVAAMVRQR